jgi:hypothetical protein
MCLQFLAPTPEKRRRLSLNGGKQPKAFKERTPDVVTSGPLLAPSFWTSRTDWQQSCGLPRFLLGLCRDGPAQGYFRLHIPEKPEWSAVTSAKRDWQNIALLPGWVCTERTRQGEPLMRMWPLPTDVVLWIGGLGIALHGAWPCACAPRSRACSSHGPAHSKLILFC